MEAAGRDPTTAEPDTADRAASGRAKGAGERWRRRAVRGLRLLARPVRRAKGARGLVVEAYRGYGSADAVFLIGRVFRQADPEDVADDTELRAALRDIARRIRRRKVAGARLTARFCGAQEEVETDADGYFRCCLHPTRAPDPDIRWHRVALTLHGETPGAVETEVEAEVFLPPGTARFCVVSDIDDTVMRTGVANKAVMLWRLFVADADERVAFPGVAELYRALYRGKGTDAAPEGNPLLYVSRAPWGIYEMLSEFFHRHAIPEGPILFLREWGLSWHRPWPRRAKDHKRALIGHMLEVYRDLPFVLIGDSGQHDPEVYADLVAAHPGRVLAVYIRDVSRGDGRRAEIERLEQAVEAAGSHLVLAADSTAIAAHAQRLGLIGRTATRTVAAVRAEDGEGARPGCA